MVPAVMGTLLLLVPLLGRRRFGDVAMLSAGAFLATSPLLVYYSRMFIHESLLACFGMAVPFLIWSGRQRIAAGVLLGLMFATKETFAISVLAWSGAGLLLAWEKREMIGKAALADAWRKHAAGSAAALALAALVSFWFYTGGFRNLQGAVDAVRTFFVYETVEGHDKPFGYYAELLAKPRKSGGMWWFETPMLLIALIGYVCSFRRGVFAGPERDMVRFLGHSAAGHFLIYSLFAYKTPWLACLPWAHVAVVAGFGVAAGFRGSRRWLTGSALLIAAAAALFSQTKQSRAACGRYASDDRNPYAYVPTRMDVERLESWLLGLKDAAAPVVLEPVAVVGTDYWPLPWYLRSFSSIGYWPAPTAEMAGMPLVLAMPEVTEELMVALEASHTSVPRGLRSGVPLQVFVRNDVWKLWMEGDTR